MIRKEIFSILFKKRASENILAFLRNKSSLKDDFKE
jgi:hypothetical protein